MIGSIRVRTTSEQETHRLSPAVDDGQHEGSAPLFIPFVERGTLIHQHLNLKRVARGRSRQQSRALCRSVCSSRLQAVCGDFALIEAGGRLGERGAASG